MITTNRNTLRAECRVFTRYLVRKAPSVPVQDRYVSACTRLLTDAPTKEQRLVTLARRRPWLLGFLDAGTALVGRDHLLRRKLLILTAILETTPEHVRRFLPQDEPLWLLLLEVIWRSTKAKVKAILGVILFKVLAR